MGSKATTGFVESEDKIDIWELRNGILILSWTHHVALGKSSNSSLFRVYKMGVVILAHRCCQHYLINEQRLFGKYKVLYKC